VSRSLFADWEPREKIKPAPRLVLAFGSSGKPFALTHCDDIHHGPIPAGSRICCAACHRSGLDGLVTFPGSPINSGAGRTEAEIKAAAIHQKLHKAETRR
jgi:hypothetical protein